MKDVLLLLLITLGLGICIGKWWEHDRVGGTLDLELAVDDLEADLEAEQLRAATLQAEVDERRAAAGVRVPRQDVSLATAIGRELRRLHAVDGSAT